MWFLITIIFIAAIFLFMQFISRLPGEKFRGLGKIITAERNDIVNDVQVDDAFEIVSGQNAPLFDTMLILSVNSPREVLFQWSISQENYEKSILTHNAQGTDTSKAVIKLNYRGRVNFKEEYPVRLADKQLLLTIDAPACELYGEIGFYTAQESFYVLARSNTVKIPG